MEWLLPEERGRVARLIGPGRIRWALRLRFILSNRIFPPEHHAPRPGVDKLDPYTDGCAAPSAIARSGVISASDDKHWIDSRLAAGDLRSDVHHTCGVWGCRKREEGSSTPAHQRAKLGLKQAFRSAPPRPGMQHPQGSPLHCL